MIYDESQKMSFELQFSFILITFRSSFKDGDHQSIPLNTKTIGMSATEQRNIGNSKPIESQILQLHSIRGKLHSSGLSDKVCLIAVCCHTGFSIQISEILGIFISIFKKRLRGEQSATKEMTHRRFIIVNFDGIDRLPVNTVING